MKILSIGTDRAIFKEGSSPRARMLQYGQLFDELHIIVFAKASLGLKDAQITTNVWVYPTQSRSRFLYMLDAITIGKKIVQSRGQKSDWIVSAQDPFETGVVGVRLARFLQAPLQIQIHTDFLSPHFAASALNRVRIVLSKWVLPKADRIRVVGERIKKSLMDSGYTLRVAPVVLPIVVDKEKIVSTAPSLDLHKKYSQFGKIVLMASRFESEKNIDVAVRAFKNVVKRVPDAGLIIVGSGSELSKLQSLVGQLDLEKSVMFEPWQSDLISYYKTADVFLSTSLYEGYGLALAGAALAGCSIVTSDVGIVGYELPRSACAVFAVGDKMELEEQLVKVLQNTTLRAAHAVEAKRAMEGKILDGDEYLQNYKAAMEGTTFAGLPR